MKRVLVAYYSQSGDVRRMAEAFTEPLQAAGMEVQWWEIKPQEPYPYPWRNVHRFFDVMPECVLGLPPPVLPPPFPPEQRFDLVVLAYPVWFLAPALPVQGLFRTPHVRVLQNSLVTTICVSRQMWHEAALRMRHLLAEAGAIHLDNIVVTHQGAPWATFITAPRTLLTGRRDRLWGLLPPPGVAEEEVERLRALGAAVAVQQDALASPTAGPLLRGRGAVVVNQRYILPELVAARCFPCWAHFIRGLGRCWRPLRHVGIFLFIHFLLLMIVVGIPLAIITLPLVYPLVRRRLAAYASRVRQPTES